HHFVQRLEGHFFRGAGDRSSKAEITPLPEAAAQAQQLLAGDLQASERLSRIERLMAGFESPYGLELLATVHWIAREDPAARTDFDQALVSVQAWSPRKRRLMQSEHLRKAWQRLRDEAWLMPASGSYVDPALASTPAHPPA
ncbi:MAG TPA: hypothetical protein VEG34_14860, partial [Thermoanaerobaculia bacterium]|nr:hypothetical protein [Thermoanaerobaculia bacterium]